MENERKVYFTCDANIDWDTYKELDQIKYRKLNRLCLVYIIIFTVFAGLLFWLKALTAAFCVALFCVSFVFLFIGVFVNKQSDRMQGHQKVKYGKDIIDLHIEFAERIYVTSSCDLDRVYEYALVEKVFETKDSIIIYMTHGFTITLDKSRVRCVEGDDFIEFIFDKCYSLKKSNFTRLKNGRNKLKYLTVLSFFISVVVLMLFFFQQTPENWRELGRNPQYSSSQQSTTDSSSDISK